jgi:hypothetical protein
MLTINDLPVSNEIETREMSAVRGGRLPQAVVDQINYVHDYIYNYGVGQSYPYQQLGRVVAELTSGN